MTRDEVIALAVQYCDASEDRRGSITYEFDDHAIEALASIIEDRVRGGRGE